jgi:hypothetical protein
MARETRRIAELKAFRGAFESISVSDVGLQSNRSPKPTSTEKLHIRPGVIHPPEKHKCNNNAPADTKQASLISLPLKGSLQLLIPIQVTHPHPENRSDAIHVSSLFAK